MAHDLARARTPSASVTERDDGRSVDPGAGVRADNLRLRSEAMELALIVRESVARRHELGGLSDGSSARPFDDGATEAAAPIVALAPDYPTGVASA